MEVKQKHAETGKIEQDGGEEDTLSSLIKRQDIQ